MTPILLGLIAYIAAQFAIGMWASRRRIQSESEYLLAGRSLGYGLATFSMFATWFGAEACIGSAGAVYGEGLSGAAADPFGYGICLVLMGLVFAIPLWRRGFTTLADLFQQRYSRGVERIAVLMMVPTSVMWAAAQIRAFGQVLSASSELDVNLATGIATLAVIVYTVRGGLRADVVTDIVQGIVLAIGLIVILVVFTHDLGGVGPLIAAIEPGRLDLFGGDNATVLGTIEKWTIPTLGSVVAQEMVTRVLASHSPQVAQRASILGGGLYLVLGLIPVIIGLAAFTQMPGVEDREQILPLIAQKHLSPILYVVFAGALLSAILSTVDSALLAAASLTTHNLVLPLRPQSSERTRVLLARSAVVAFGLVAYALALSYDSIYELVADASAFGGAGIFVIVCFGLFSRFGGVWSAHAALTAGAAIWFYGKVVADVPYAYLTSLACSLVAYGVVAVFEARLRATTGRNVAT